MQPSNGSRTTGLGPVPDTWRGPDSLHKPRPWALTVEALERHRVAVEVYHPAANRWTRARPLSVPREGAGVATTTGGRIVVIDGCRTPAHRLYRTADIYRPRTNRWHWFPGLPVPRAGLAAARGPDGLIYAIAGFQREPPNTPASHLLDAIRLQ